MIRYVFFFIIGSLSLSLSAQDMCSGAYDLGTLVCGDFVTGTGDAGTTPDAEATSCMSGLNGTWYTFTTSDPLYEFTISGTDYELFEGSCGSVNFIDGCGNGIVIAADPNLQYYVLVFDNFDIDTPGAASNDQCADAADATGGVTGEDNNCSDTDDGMCGSDGNASVWYSIDVTQDLESIDITVVSNGITNPAVGLYENCSTLIMDDCSGALSVSCIVAGTYYIQVSSDFGNEGAFDLDIIETASSVSNETCDSAEDITPSESCVFETVSGDSSGACPESSDFGSGCDIDVNPTIWYEFTTGSNTSSIDLENLTGNLELTVIEGDCSGPATACISSNTNVIVNANTTYYIAASLTSGGGSIEFDIALNDTPSNDLCSDAEDIFSGDNQSTCCGSIEGTDDCGGSDTGVWFEHFGPDGDASLYEFVNIDMTGNIGIEIYEGSCTGPLLNEPYCGAAGNYDVEIPNCGATYHYIHITSSDGGCGSFELTVTPIVACLFGEECGEGPTLAPSTGGAEECVEGCNQFACDSDCSNNGVWFVVETDELATEMSVVVNDINGSNIDPIITIIQAECSGGALVSCADVSSGDITEVAVSGNLMYFIEVSSGSGGDPGEFELCVTTDESLVECSDGSLEPTRPEYPDADPNGPYCPGEIVNFCYDVTFTVDPIGQGNNCQWIQGIIPTVGGGWDLESLTLESQGPGGSWFWLAEEEVNYQAPSSILGLINTPHGLGLEYGPGTLTEGDGLPAGWWSTSSGGGGCANDGNPNTMWGLPASCGSSTDVSFCFDLQVKELDDPSQCDDPDMTDLKVHIFTMADGQTGCWSNNSCSGDTPVTFNAEIDCTSLVFILGEDQEICNNDELELLVETEDGSDTDIVVEVIDEGNTSGATDWEFTGGSGFITDQIENEGEDVEIVIYEAYAVDPNSMCEGPRTEIEVIVYPDIEVEGEDPYYICYQDPQEITPLITGGAGGPYEYLWEDGSDGPSIVVPDNPDQFPGEYTVSLMVTDAFGCTTEALVEYEIVEPLYPTILNPYVGVCKDGVEDLPELWLDFESAGTGPYDFQWTANPGGLEFENGDNDQNLIINEEESSARTYTIFGTITDDYGCEYTAQTELTVDNGPDLVLEVLECLGTSFNIQGYERQGQLINFQLFYDAEGDWLFDGMTIVNAELVASSFGTVIDYFAEDYGSYILLGTSSNGCHDYVELVLPPVPQPQFDVMPNDTVCAGTQITVSVLNSSDYVNFSWSNGENGSSFVDTPLDTIKYYLVAETLDDCEILDSLEVIVNPLPEIQVTGSTAICPGSETVLTAQGDSLSSYLWTGPNGEMITSQTATISAAGDWSIMIVSGSGCMNSEIITIEENAQLNPVISGSDICTGSTAILDGGPGFDQYEWLDGSGMMIGDEQIIEVSVGGEYTLNVVLGSGGSACMGTDVFTVNQFDPVPDALNNTGSVVCNIDNGSLPTVLDLSSFETGVPGSWFDNNNLPVADPTNVDFAGLPPATYVYSFVTNAAMAPCVDETFPLSIEVSDCSCPSVAIGQLPDFCVGVDTFNLNLIRITDEPGVWSISNASIQILDSLLILDENTSSGEVMLSYSLTSSNIPPSCQTDSTILFTVWEPLDAELLTDVRVCNEDTGNGPDFLDLDDLFVSGDPGVWTSDDPSLIIDADNIVSFAGVDIDNYRFFYYMEDNMSACPPVTLTTVVEVIDCSCPTLDMMPLDDLCDSGGEIILNDFLINPDNIAGSWSISGPDPSALIGASFFSSGRTPGDYTITFSFTNPVGGSCINSVSQSLTIHERPAAIVSPQEFACNGTSITVYPTVLNLFDYVQGSSGDWTAGPEYNGGVLNDATQVDFEGLNPGIYTFSFTTNTAVQPCEEVSYELDINVRNCNCPFVDFILPTPLCNDGPDVDLNDYLPADAEEGSWSFINGTPNIDLTNTTVFSLGNLEGFYLFQYTLDTVPVGCPDFGQINIEVVAPPDVNHIPEDNVCSVESVIAENCIDLTTYVTGVPGSWTFDPTFNGDSSDTTTVCFDNENPGEVLLFVFNTETGSPTCDERQYVTQFTVLDCNCPNLLLNQAPELCTTDSNFDLTALESNGIAEGSWSFIDGPVSLPISGSGLDIGNAETGIYLLRYTPDETPSSDCDPFSEIEITIVYSPDIGQTVNSGDCLEDGSVVRLEDYLLGTDEGGEWSLNNNVLPTDAQGNTFFTADAINPGEYNFVYGFYGIDPCEELSLELVLYVSHTVSAEVLDSPCADANAGTIIVASIGTGTGNLYSIDGGLNWSTNTSFDNLEPGNYTLMIEDENGCIMSLEDIVVSEPGPFSVDAGEDREIEEGPEFTNLQLASNLDVSEIVHIEWTENGSVICSGGPDQCWSIDVDPDEIAEYCATVTDINGCVSTDCVIIRERLVKDVYIPNIFRPGSVTNDGIFYVQADQYVDVINEFRIYDRWGNLVFDAQPDHKPNEKEYGWDGTMNDDYMEQGVYVYVIVLTYVDGEEESFVGDITLLTN